MTSAPALLVVGIHREELAFGDAVAARLDASCVDVLRIDEGLSGRRPRADERFRYDTLHRALYLQLLAHVQSHHRLLIDLHTGLDADGPCADLYSRDPARLSVALSDANLQPAPRLYDLLGEDHRNEAAHGGQARTVIPAEVWRKPRFLYVGLESYLPAASTWSTADLDYARSIVRLLCAHA